MKAGQDIKIIKARTNTGKSIYMNALSKFIEFEDGDIVPTVFTLTPNGETMKPTVYYTKANSPIVAGERVSVDLIEHYRLGQSNGHRAFTSPVVAVGEDGTTFETKNSMYVQRDVPEKYEPMYHPV